VVNKFALERKKTMCSGSCPNCYNVLKRIWMERQLTWMRLGCDLDEVWMWMEREFG